MHLKAPEVGALVVVVVVVVLIGVVVVLTIDVVGISSQIKLFRSTQLELLMKFPWYKLEQTPLTLTQLLIFGEFENNETKGGLTSFVTTKSL